jgi:hypothetical protein
MYTPIDKLVGTFFRDVNRMRHLLHSPQHGELCRRIEETIQQFTNEMEDRGLIRRVGNQAQRPRSRRRRG